jgi:two-component system nitrate/nitrite response regulator NarL
MHKETAGHNFLLIDRSRLFRAGIKTLLSTFNFQFVGEVGSLRDALQQTDFSQRLDLIILDFDTRDDDELELLGELRQSATNARFVVLTGEITYPRLARALTAGVDGYLLKDMSPDALVQSLRLVLLGEKVFPTDLASLLMNGDFETVGNRGVVERSRGLSEREIQILAFLVTGFSNKAIAKRLDVTEGTVKVHLKSLLRKLNVTNRTQAAIWALNSGIGVTPPEPAPHATARAAIGRSPVDSEEAALVRVGNR